MLNSIDNFIINTKTNISEYSQHVFRKKLFNRVLILIRLVLYIPCVVFIILMNLIMFPIDGCKQTILWPLLENKRLLIELDGSYEESKSNFRGDHFIKNYFYSVFEGFILVAVYAINVSIYAIKGSANLVFLFLSFSNLRLFKLI